MGVDLGINKISCVTIEDGVIIHARTFVSRETNRGKVLAELARDARSLVFTYNVDTIWLEDVLIGNNRKYSMQLAETKGAVLSQVGNTGARVEMVNVQSWKKRVLGSGHANKDDIKNYIRETHPAYALLCGADQDLYDAACIGLYGIDVAAQAADLQELFRLHT